MSMQPGGHSNYTSCSRADMRSHIHFQDWHAPRPRDVRTSCARKPQLPQRDPRATRSTQRNAKSHATSSYRAPSLRDDGPTRASARQAPRLLPTSTPRLHPTNKPLLLVADARPSRKFFVRAQPTTERGTAWGTNNEPLLKISNNGMFAKIGNLVPLGC